MSARAAGPGTPAGTIPVVAHSVRKFLAMSQNWIYPQVVALRRYSSVVVTNQAKNLEAFPLPPERLHVIQRRHRPWAERVSSLAGLGRDTPSYWRRALGPTPPAVIHSHFGNRGYIDLNVAKRMRVPHVVTFYGHDLSRLPRDPVWRGRFSRLFEQATLFTVEGAHMKRTLEALGCAVEKIRIRRHGVETAEVAFVPRVIGEDGVARILVAARFVEKKGVPVAIRAVAEIARRYPNLRLTVLGDTEPDEPGGQQIRDEVQSLLQSAPLLGRSQWLGAVSFQEFMRIAAEHHVFVQASQHARDGDSEGGAPVALTQLAATGMPIVATSHCDIPEVVLDGVTGFLAPEGNVEALSEGLERMVSAPERWSELGRRARGHVGDKFEMSRCIADLEAIYDAAVRVGR